MTEYAPGASLDQARKLLEESHHAREKVAAAVAERAKGRPTPTQEENDLAALGAHVLKHDDDGSGPDPDVVARHMEAGSGAAPYQTRQAAAGRPAPPKPAA